MIHVVAGVLLAAALLTAPGLLLARLGGVRGWSAASAALPLSCAVIGTAEIVAAAVGSAWVPWGWAAIAGVTAVAAGLLVAVRRLVPGGRTQSADPPRDGGGRSDLRVPAGLAVACLVLGIGTLAGMGSMSTPAQAFDIVFHSNAVQAIRQLGNASSFGSMSALYQGVPTYYPTVWHGAVALLPASVTVSSNAMVLVVAALAWPLGIAGLLAEVLGAEHPRNRTAIALGTVLSAATVGAPTMLLGTLAVWAYTLSVICLPGVVVLGLRLLRSVPADSAGEGALEGFSEGESEEERARTRSSLSDLIMNGVLFVGGGIGAVLAHGAGTFNTMVLLGPLAVVLIVRLVRAGGRRKTVTLRILAVLAVCVLIGAWVMRESLVWVWRYPRGGGNLLGTLGLRRLLEARPGRRMTAVLLVLVCAAAVGRMPLHAKLARSVHDADRIAYGTILTSEEADFITSLSDQLPEDALVVGAPSRGESYLWALGGIDVVYPLRSRPTQGTAADMLASAAPDLRPGSTTCQLLNELGAEYYFRADRGAAWDGREAPLRWDKALADWPTDGMEPVASTSTAGLWRITACGD